MIFLARILINAHVCCMLMVANTIGPFPLIEVLEEHTG